ncbi:hypothetical protein [Parapedobacter sp. DT-150]|uniref:hypothetical protein n=1 Tax=Parapedobacter sp. DT-150 TaxID=3396162 RepID=UPI003F1C04CC
MILHAKVGFLNEKNEQVNIKKPSQKSLLVVGKVDTELDKMTAPGLSGVATGFCR